MQIPLGTSATKIIFLISCLAAVLLYLTVATCQFAASVLAEKPDGLQLAVRLDPYNARYEDELGKVFSLRPRLSDALHAYEKATELNPGHASYWLHLAAAENALGNLPGQRNALLRAAAVDPKNTRAAWEIGNIWLAEGDLHSAFQEFKTTLEGAPFLSGMVIEHSWDAEPDVEILLRDVLPASPAIYSSFLEFLISKNETAAALRVWEQIAQLAQPVNRSDVLDYVRFLIAHRQPGQARLIWEQAAPLCDLGAYQQSQENLVINGDFNLPIVNGGFDWTYEKRPDISLEFDPTQSRAGSPSLLLSFDSGGLEDSGIRQLIAVEPGTPYHFSAYFKTQNLEGAGGPQFVLQDYYTDQLNFSSEDLKESGDWKPINGDLQTGAGTNLLLLRIRRDPPGSAIRGKLWISNVRLEPRHQENVK